MKSIRNNNLSGFALILALSLLTAACNKDDFDINKLNTDGWQPELAFPLVYTEIGVNELVNDNDSNTTVVIDQNQFCTLVYDGRAFELSATQLVNIPDQQFQQEFRLSNNEILTLGNTGQVQMNYSQSTDFSLSNGIEIDTVLFKSGNLNFQFNSDFTADAEVLITIPDLKKNGIALQTLVLLDYNGTTPVLSSQDIPMAGYKFDLTDSRTTHNRINVNYQVTITGSSSGVSGSNKIESNISFQALNYELLFGYIGQQNFSNIQDTLEISIFNNSIGSGAFTVAEPKIRFDISNSLGIPFNARISQLTAMQSNMTDFTVATGVPDPLPVPSPGINEVGQVKQSSFTLDKDNSNITSMFAEQPRYLITQMQNETNPSGRAINYIFDTSKLTVDIHAELPFYGSTKDFTIKDTVPFNYNDLANVEELMLRIQVENGFPIQSSIQLIFIDEMNNSLDSMFLPGEVVVPSGSVDFITEKVTMPGRKLLDRYLTQVNLQKILTAKNIIVAASATTFNNGNSNVKIFADYKLKIKIGAIAKMKIQ